MKTNFLTAAFVVVALTACHAQSNVSSAVKEEAPAASNKFACKAFDEKNQIDMLFDF